MSQHAVYRDTFNYVALLQLFVDLTTHFVFIIVIIKKNQYDIIRKWDFVFQKNHVFLIIRIECIFLYTKGKSVKHQISVK